MADDEIQELKEKLQAQQAQFDNYKEQSKQLEEFLQGQALKKEQQIKQLKQQSIKKEKNYNLLKTQVSQLEAENRNLRQQLSTNKSTDGGQELQMLRAEIEGLKRKNEELASGSLKLTLLQEQSKKMETEIQQLKNKLEQKESQLNQRQGLSEVNNEKQLRETLQSHQKVINQLKNKNLQLLTQNEQLLSEIKSKFETKSPIKQQYSIEEEPQITPQSQQTISALILTKKHYISPFMQLRSDNSIKIYKSIKSGYQKSLGATRHKLTKITYESERLIDQTVYNIKNNLKQGIKYNSIIIFGIKKSNKKHIMASILAELKEFFMEQIHNEDRCQAMFLKHSTIPEKRMNLKGETKEDAMRIMEQVIDMGAKKEKKNDHYGKKKTSKPKIRYFKLTFSDQIFELITTSYTSVQIKNGSNIVEALNQICYGKLPNILQSSEAHKQIILTLNPILNFYEDCKTTLCLTNCSLHPLVHSPSKRMESPVKEFLKDTVRRRFQSIEKVSEQNSMKTKKLEDQVSYYRSKFDELQVWLKNLLSVYYSQNPYLKKSPVALSYEKMLKFVHSTIGRNNLKDEGYHEINH